MKKRKNRKILTLRNYTESKNTKYNYQNNIYITLIIIITETLTT